MQGGKTSSFTLFPTALLDVRHVTGLGLAMDGIEKTTVRSIPWTLSLGHWSGVLVRVHVSLPLAAIWALLMACQVDTVHGGKDVSSFPKDRMVIVAIMGIAAIAFHVVGHILAAARSGIEVREITLAPWGEWNPVETGRSAEAALYTHLSGIAINGIFCTFTAMALWLSGDSTVGELVIPLDRTHLLVGDSQLVLLRWMFGLNYILLLINLLPAAPFDGGRIVGSSLDLLLPHWNRRGRRVLQQVIARMTGVTLVVAAIAVINVKTGTLLPLWFPLAVLGLVALFASEERAASTVAPSIKMPPNEQDMTSEVNYEAEFDADEHFSSLDADDMDEGPFAQWLQERKELARRRRLEQEQTDDHRVDEILARLHEKGLTALSADERKVLERVSDRIRRRNHRRSSS